MNKKFTIYIVGIISGVGLFYLYILSSASDDTISHQKQLMEKFKEVESVTHKNSTLVHQFDILTEENTKLSLDVENLQIQLSEYKSIVNQKEEEELAFKLTLELSEKKAVLNPKIEEYNAVLNLTEEQQHQIKELEWKLYLNRTTPHELRNFEDSASYASNIKKQINSILSDEQIEMLKMYQKQKRNTKLEATAIRELAKYPDSMNLTEEQKDFIFQNLYKLSHPDTRREKNVILIDSTINLTEELKDSIFQSLYESDPDTRREEYVIRRSDSKYKEFGYQEKKMLCHSWGCQGSWGWSMCHSR